MSQVPLVLEEGETFDNEGISLNGKTAEIIRLFRKRVVGHTVVDVGYVLRDDGYDEGPTAWPCLVMDNGHLLTSMMDDEGNGPGVMCFQDSRLCKTHKVQILPPKKQLRVDEDVVE